MSALTTTTANEAITIKVVAKHDIQTLIGYTRPPVDGGEPSMDDLTSEHPLYRDIRSSYVYDVRGFEDQFTLETHGFSTSNCHPYLDKESLTSKMSWIRR